jgi:hypothetical protein
VLQWNLLLIVLNFIFFTGLDNSKSCRCVPPWFELRWVNSWVFWAAPNWNRLPF